MSETAIVIAVHRGGCEAIHDDRVLTLRLMGRHAELELALAVGDEITFDPEREIVLEQQPRRTRLARQRRRGEQVIAANMDRLGIVCSVVRPPFRSGLVDRSAVLVNISLSGAMLESSSVSPSPGTILRIKFTPPQSGSATPVELKGRVVRCTSEGFAIQFLTITKELEQLVKSLS